MLLAIASILSDVAILTVGALCGLVGLIGWQRGRDIYREVIAELTEHLD